MSYTGYQSSTGIPTRYAFPSTNVCMRLPHRTSSSNIYRLQSTLLRAVYSLLPTTTSCIREQTWYAAVSVVSASSIQELGTSFHQTLETRRWALITFVEDLKLRYLTERIMRLSAHSWWTWLIRVGVISVQTYLLTNLLNAASDDVRNIMRDRAPNVVQRPYVKITPANDAVDIVLKWQILVQCYSNQKDCQKADSRPFNLQFFAQPLSICLYQILLYRD